MASQLLPKVLAQFTTSSTQEPAVWKDRDRASAPSAGQHMGQSKALRTNVRCSREAYAPVGVRHRRRRVQGPMQEGPTLSSLLQVWGPCRFKQGGAEFQFQSFSISLTCNQDNILEN